MSQEGAYSELKSIWWLARESLSFPAAPKQVHWILSDLCNEDCNFCSYRISGGQSTELFTEGTKTAAYGHNNPVRWVDTQRALRLVDEMKSLGVLAVQATGGGEPTVHPDHELIFARILDSGILLSLVSNGYRWRDAIWPLIPRMSWLRVSVDAGKEATYSKMRDVPMSALMRVLRNVARAAEEIRKANSQTVLGIGFTVTPDNWQEIDDGAKLAKASGAHNIRLSAMFGPENEKPFLPIYDGIRAKIDLAKRLYEGSGFKIYDNFGSRLEDLVQRSPDYSVCPYQNYTSYIGGDLNVYRCCVTSYTRRGLVVGGNLKNQRFDDYWRSEARRNDFSEFDARGCPRCMFNGKNRALLYVMGDKPTHAEFP